MAVAVSSSASGNAASGTTVTVSGFTTTGSNRLVLAIPGSFNTGYVTGVTYGGGAMTYAGQVSIGGICFQDLYYLIAPTTSSSDVVATWGSTVSGGAALLVIAYTGVHQSAPLGTITTASNGTSALITGASGSKSTDDLYLDIGSATLGGGTTYTPIGTGHSEVVGLNPYGGWGLFAGSMTGSGTVSPEWTLSVSQSWTQLGVPILASASGSTITSNVGSYISTGTQATLRVGSKTWLRHRK